MKSLKLSLILMFAMVNTAFAADDMYTVFTHYPSSTPLSVKVGQRCVGNIDLNHSIYISASMLAKQCALPKACAVEILTQVNCSGVVIANLSTNVKTGESILNYGNRAYQFTLEDYVIGVS